MARQSITADGLDYSFRGDLLVRSMETALGYLNISFDMTRIAYPESEEDLWENLALDFAKTAGAYEEDFQGFSGTTVSECDQRIRNFLAVKFTQRRENNEIFLDFTSMEVPAWFVLRTDKEVVTHVENGNSQMIEKGAYLIEASDAHVTIELAPEEE